MKHVFPLLNILFFLGTGGSFVSAQVYTQTMLIPFKNNNEWGYINKAGQTMIQPRFAEAAPFDQGLAVVKMRLPETKELRVGIIDTTGLFVVEPVYTEIGRFAERLARVKIDGLYGYIDRTGKMIIEPQFQEAQDFSEGYARVRVLSNYGLIDKYGKFA
ncbi:MAG: WG repeat-containing protein, partial [Spirochaetia bacterium]|nr:WG repeat-containing protein [Spirochaetia bacterium]